MRKLPDWIDSYIKFSDNSEASYLYRLYSAIFGISAALQRKCWFEWHSKIYSNVFIALSGPSGSRKNTAIDPIRLMLEEIEVPLSPMASRRGLAKAMEAVKRDAVWQPSGEFIVHSSLAVIAEEMVIMFGTDSQDMIKHLVHWYDCKTHEYLTNSQGSDKVINPCLTSIGGITPELISSTLHADAVGGGLFSRMLFIYSPRKGKQVIFPFMTKEDLSLRDRLVNDLNEIKLMVGKFTVDEKFLEKYGSWYKAHDGSTLFRNTILTSYTERKQVHVFKLCMASSASRGDSFVITGEDFDRTLGWLNLAEQEMLKPFSGFGKNELAQSTSQILAAICYDGETSLFKLLGEFYRDVSREELIKVLYALQQMGEINLEPLKGGDFRVTKRIKDT